MDALAHMDEVVRACNRTWGTGTSTHVFSKSSIPRLCNGRQDTLAVCVRKFLYPLDEIQDPTKASVLGALCPKGRPVSLKVLQL